MRMTGNPGRVRSQTLQSTTPGAEALGVRGKQTKNKDQLGSDRNRTMSTKPAARLDEFGSRHNADERKKTQQKGRIGGRSNLAFRESAQDTRAATGNPGKKHKGSQGLPRKSKRSDGKGKA